MEHKNRWHSSHTYVPDECKWATAQVRQGSSGTGRHPREPARPASDDPTAGLPGHVEGEELGADAERELQPVEEPGPIAVEESPSSSTDPANRRTRGPDTTPRIRTTTQETSTTPPNTTDWTNFDVARALRVLRVGSDAQQRLTLRKLHLVGGMPVQPL